MKDIIEQKEQKLKISYQTKGIVECSGENDGVYKEVSLWSNILESALNNDYKLLENLISIASAETIKEDLFTLEKALKISKDYQVAEAVYFGWQNGEHYEFHQTYESMMPKKLMQVRINLLCHLTKDHYLSIAFSESDKRLIELGLNRMINNINDLDELIGFYNKYDQLGILDHQRNPIMSQIQNSLFKARYSKLKEKFILASQEKALILLDKRDHSDINLDLLNQLKGAIFSPVHARFGISNMEFSQIYHQYDAQMRVVSKNSLEF